MAETDRADRELGAAAVRREEPESVTTLRLLNALLQHWKLSVGLPIGMALLFVGTALLASREWTSTVLFMPEGRVAESRLTSLASRFGFDFDASDESRSVQFYARLLLTPQVLSAIVAEPIETGRGTRSLLELFDLSEKTVEKRREEGIERLSRAIHIRPDPETSVVRVSVTLPWRDAAVSVASLLVSQLERFDLESRRTQAAAERRFIEARLGEMELALDSSEANLKRFLTQNRRYENSPELRFEYETLQRRVDLHQQLVVSLSESLQDARIEEVRNTPVLTVIQPATRPARPDPRRLWAKGLLGLLIGGFLGFVGALGAEFVERVRSGEGVEHRRTRRLSREARAEIESLWASAKRPVTRLFSREASGDGERRAGDRT